MAKRDWQWRRLPVVSLGAEHLVIGHLMRRNILTYKAPPNNEGYDLICMHPDPRKARKQIRVQVKSRYQTDSNRAIMIKEKSLESFDYLVIVFMNIGFFYRKKPTLEGRREPEFYVLPRRWVKKHHLLDKGWEKIKTKGLALSRYKDEEGFERIAKKLGIEYPGEQE